MIENTTYPEERRTRSHEIVENLLAERQELLVRFCRVAGLEPFNPHDPPVDTLRAFCQVLVDYVAAVHFEVFARLSEGGERRQAVTRMAEQEYPRIAELTEIAVDFNDRYAQVDLDTLSARLADDLSNLGQTLAERFELEDQVFAALVAAR